jgi:hypothetical protein
MAMAEVMARFLPLWGLPLWGGQGSIGGDSRRAIAPLQRLLVQAPGILTGIYSMRDWKKYPENRPR